MPNAGKCNTSVAVNASWTRDYLGSWKGMPRHHPFFRWESRQISARMDFDDIFSRKKIVSSAI